tara:strand:+ start:325 stop:1206 length:882 start_codon:yes stop_codon:yes gene_type:complete
MGTISKVSGMRHSDISNVNGQSPNVDLSGSVSPIPSVSVSGGPFGAVEATITKAGGGTYTNPNYSAECTLADGTVTVTDANIDRVLESDSSHLAGTLNFVDSYNSTAQRTIKVRAQEFGDLTKSEEGTATYTPSYAQNTYLRIQSCDSSGTHTASWLQIADIRFYEGSGQTGTVHPSANLTSNTSDSSVEVSIGHVYNATYAAWKACDSNIYGTQAWCLGNSTPDNDWFQIEFTGSAPVIKSFKVIFASYHGTHFKVTGSNNADHSSATTYGIFEVTHSQASTTGSVQYINIG